MVTRLGASADLIDANSRTTIPARSEMCRYMLPPQNLRESQPPTIEAPLAAGSFSKSGDAGSLTGIPILSSRAVGIEHPVYSVSRQSGPLSRSIDAPRDNSRFVGKPYLETTSACPSSSRNPRHAATPRSWPVKEV